MGVQPFREVLLCKKVWSMWMLQNFSASRCRIHQTSRFHPSGSAMKSCALWSGNVSVTLIVFARDGFSMDFREPLVRLSSSGKVICGLPGLCICAYQLKLLSKGWTNENLTQSQDCFTTNRHKIQK